MQSFSKLDIDDKTYNHARCFYIALVNSQSFIGIENQIQQHELEDHLKRCGYAHNTEECANWIRKNAEPFRSYINSLKLIALMMFIDNKRNYRDNFSRDLFFTYVQIFDQYSFVLDTIRIESK